MQIQGTFTNLQMKQMQISLEHIPKEIRILSVYFRLCSADFRLCSGYFRLCFFHTFPQCPSIATLTLKVLTFLPNSNCQSAKVRFHGQSLYVQGCFGISLFTSGGRSTNLLLRK